MLSIQYQFTDWLSISQHKRHRCVPARVLIGLDAGLITKLGDLNELEATQSLWTVASRKISCPYNCSKRAVIFSILKA
ncbi:hypothetical protein N7539_002249 [Penicillium diatomitis]|uniref:Uncharacterized protein n=1 Tax=Penicillium diatomitis TaxID=2819901 RepID=A0A9W9XI99_9EURO|nr:uncharacterized protein N7539_002249 [Penicillium diatomitis]KAJ5493503.1 hypothetical protein N7539_002249 [Penicillium diatomitis]